MPVIGPERQLWQAAAWGRGRSTVTYKEPDNNGYNVIYLYCSSSKCGRLSARLAAHYCATPGASGRQSQLTGRLSISSPSRRTRAVATAVRQPGVIHRSSGRWVERPRGTSSGPAFDASRSSLSTRSPTTPLPAHFRYHKPTVRRSETYPGWIHSGARLASSRSKPLIVCPQT